MIEIGSEARLDELATRGLLTFSEATVVHGIEPADMISASTWLIWAATGIEALVYPPTFEDALQSRIVNINDYFNYSIAPLAYRAQRIGTWSTASSAARSIAGNVDEIGVLKDITKNFMSRHQELHSAKYFVSHIA